MQECAFCVKTTRVFGAGASEPLALMSRPSAADRGSLVFAAPVEKKQVKLPRNDPMQLHARQRTYPYICIRVKG